MVDRCESDIKIPAADADNVMVTGMTVKRWQRHGHDRLYVAAPDGTRVGWHDLATGVDTIELPEHAAGFSAALTEYRSRELTAHGSSPARSAAPSTPRPTREAAPSAPVEDRDLAANTPGQAAREQAEAAWEARRSSSRVRAWAERITDAKTEERAWRVGADGEQAIGTRLDRLKSHGWYVLHAVPVGDRGSDIDHVLVGPGGVYTVNTKKHPNGKIWVGRRSIRVNGHPVQYIRNSTFEGTRAERLLTEAVGYPVIVRPILVFTTGTLIPNVTIKQQPDDVTVLDRTDIPGVFKKAPVRLADWQVEQIFAAARRSSTWTKRG